jgi:2-polyprenyl-3-methyl-5-hydroxy-6-metoxy-1,4-benzoquinol methylase
MRHVVDALDDPRTHEHVDLRGDVDALLQRLTELEMEVRRIQHTTAASGAVEADHIDIDWAAFADRFRGSDEHLAEHYQDLVDRLADQGPVLDLGCGGGFLVEALAQRGTEARGVDTDLDLVRSAGRRGLDVTQQTAAGALAGAAPDSLGAVVMLHVVEHLAPAELPSIVRAAHQALVDGGLLVIETPNAASLYAHSHSFWLDPTHVRMVPALYLELVLTQAGFRDIEILPRSPVPDDERLAELPSDVPGASVHNENIRRLNDVIFAPQDVMVVGVA